MSELLQTTSDSLCKLVRWAHSHGTICNLIPSLRRLTSSSHSAMLTPGPGPHGNNVPVAVWSCGAGHAYHWPLSDRSIRRGQKRFVEEHPSNKVTVRMSCDLSCSEGEEFNSPQIVGCDSSATDEDEDYEPCSSRKRGGTSGGAVVRKKVKQEVTSADSFDPTLNTVSMGLAVTDASGVSQACQSPITHTLFPSKLLTPASQPQHGLDLGHEGSEDPKTELLGGSCMTGTTEQADRCSSATETTGKTAGVQNELEKLRALLLAEQSRNQQMTEIISSLKQDKELLQHQITNKAKLICNFLQDKLRPEKRLRRCSNQTEPGSSHMRSPDDVAGLDVPTMFDSFEEIELHSLEHHQSQKSKRNREGENTRVRMKNVVGVIARYMAALQEFRRSVSMKVAFDRVGVDRNTISRTAAIAELSLAAPEVFHALAPWDEKEETLAHYAHRCRQAMDENIKAKIKTMKAKGELLPIVSK